MSVNDQTNGTAKFSDMQLKVGQRVLLILEGAGSHKQYTNIIGWVENQFLILRVPQEDGWIVHIREGMNLEIRLLTGLSIFNFKCRVNHLLLNPRNYMLMSFPNEIHETPMREHIRVLTTLPAEILCSAMVGANAKDYRLHDLSIAGMSVVGPFKLGEVSSGLQVKLSFDLQSTGKFEEVVLSGKIQNVEPIHPDNKSESKPHYRHGIRFDETDVKVALLVHELQKLVS